MQQWIAIAAGGALGALARYGVASAVHGALGRGFPYGTLVVNALGSLLIGVCYVALVERTQAAGEWRALLMVGFLGAFTTFSTFSLESLGLLERAEYGKAVANVLLNVLLCLLAAGAGLWLARRW